MSSRSGMKINFLTFWTLAMSSSRLPISSCAHDNLVFHTPNAFFDHTLLVVIPPSAFDPTHMTSKAILTLLVLVVPSATATWTRSQDPYAPKRQPVNVDWERSIPRVQEPQHVAPYETIWDVQMPMIHSQDSPRLRGSWHNGGRN